MTITERILKLLNDKKIKYSDFANAIGAKPQVINNWKNRGTTPPMEYLPQICETLDISWEYLITGKEKREYYTEEEKHLIEEYRNCSNIGKSRIREYAQEMRKLHPEQEREPETEAKIS